MAGLDPQARGGHLSGPAGSSGLSPDFTGLSSDSPGRVTPPIRQAGLLPPLDSQGMLYHLSYVETNGLSSLASPRPMP